MNGQRQVGKTSIIERFGRHNYGNVVFVDFVENENIKNAFDGDLDTDSILMALGMYLPDARFVPGNTLIVFEKADTYVSDDGVEHYSLFAIAFLESLETPWNGPEF